MRAVHHACIHETLQRAARRSVTRLFEAEQQGSVANSSHSMPRVACHCRLWLGLPTQCWQHCLVVFFRNSRVRGAKVTICMHVCCDHFGCAPQPTLANDTRALALLLLLVLHSAQVQSATTVVVSAHASALVKPCAATAYVCAR
jgi:hypothetical protein